MKLIVVIALFLLLFVCGQGAKQVAKNKLLSRQDSKAFQKDREKGKELATQDAGMESESQYDSDKQDMDKQNRDSNYDENQYDDLNARRKNVNKDYDELERAKERVRLAKNTRKGDRDRGRIRATENEAKDKGTNSEDLSESFKNKKLKNASKSKLNVKNHLNASKKNKTKGNGGSMKPLFNDSSQRIGFGNSLGNLQMEQSELGENEGRRKGKKVSTYDKSAKGKTLDHIYDKQRWDDSSLVYEGDKEYQRLKKAKEKARHGGKSRDRGLVKKQSDRNSRDSLRSNVGKATQKKKQHDNRKHAKSVDKSRNAGSKKTNTNRIANKSTLK